MTTRLYSGTALVIAVVIALPGCKGYSHGFAMPRGAEDVRTIAVEMFKNRTLYTDVEFEFTDALRKEICAKTRLKIAPRDKADALVTGSIESYRQVVLRELETDAVARYSIVVTVSYKFIRLPSRGERPRVIRSSRKLSRSAEYEVLSRFREAEARAEVVRRAARKVVSHIFETW